MDIENYNYVDQLFFEWRSGKLAEPGANKDEESNGLNAGVSFLTMEMQPNGLSFKRDNADFMNNFFVDIVCRSFTSIEEQQRQFRENNEANKKAVILKELDQLKNVWRDEIENETSNNF